jgi:hypothetical protein
MMLTRMYRRLALAGFLLALAAPQAAEAYPTRAELRQMVVRPPAPTPAPIVEDRPEDPYCSEGAGTQAFYDPVRHAIVHCFARPAEPTWDDRHVREHELGHAFDQVMLDDYEREWFRDLMGLKTRPWWILLGAEWASLVPHGYSHASPGEIFADAYAYCRLRTVFTWRSAKGTHSLDVGSGYDPTNFQHRRVCRFIDIAAAD